MSFKYPDLLHLLISAFVCFNNDMVAVCGSCIPQKLLSSFHVFSRAMDFDIYPKESYTLASLRNITFIYYLRTVFYQKIGSAAYVVMHSRLLTVRGMKANSTIDMKYVLKRVSFRSKNKMHHRTETRVCIYSGPDVLVSAI